MGDSYSVIARLHFKNNDPSNWCKKVSEYVKDKTNKGEAIFCEHTEDDFKDPWRCFILLTTDQIVCKDDDLDIWTADFDASYGWGYICESGFGYAMDELKPGSFVIVYPWSGEPTTIHVNDNGNIVYDDLHWKEVFPEEYI